MLALAPAAITLESAGEPASRIIERLAEQSGEAIELGRGFEDEILVVRFDQTPWPEVKTNIAWALHAKWTESEGRQILVPDSVARKAARAELDSEWVKKIKQDLASAPPLPATAAEFWEKQKRFWELSTKSERTREELQQMSALRVQADLKTILAQDIVRSLSDQELTDLLQRGRVVYSTKPTRMQAALPPAVSAAMDRHFQRVAALSELEEVKAPPEQGNFRLRTFQAELRSMPAAIDLAMISLTATTGSISVSATLYGGGRVTAISGNSNTSSVIGPPRTDIDVVVPNAQVSITPKMRLISQGWTPTMGTAKVDLAAYRAALKNWEEEDPLAVVVGPTLLAWSRAADKPFVASVADSLIVSGASEKGDSLEIAAKIPNWIKGFDLEVRDQSILSVRHRDPEATQSRVPRAPLAAWIAEAEAADEISAESWLRLIASTNNDRQTQNVLYVAPSAFGQSSAGAFRPGLLRLAASVILGDEAGRENEWRAVVGGLTSTQRETLTEEFVRQRVTVHAIDAEVQGGPGSMSTSIMTPAFEPTYTYGGGIPPQAVLTVRHSLYPKVEFEAKNGQSWSSGGGIESYARRLAQSEFERMTSGEGPTTKDLNTWNVRIEGRNLLEMVLATPEYKSVVFVELPLMKEPQPYVDSFLYEGPFKKQLHQLKQAHLEELKKGGGSS